MIYHFDIEKKKGSFTIWDLFKVINNRFLLNRVEIVIDNLIKLFIFDIIWFVILFLFTLSYFFLQECFIKNVKNSFDIFLFFYGRKLIRLKHIKCIFELRNYFLNTRHNILSRETINKRKSFFGAIFDVTVFRKKKRNCLIFLLFGDHKIHYNIFLDEVIRH